MNFFDTVMSGRVSAQDLAGVAIGSSIWVPIFTGINGVLLALTPIVAHLSGAKKRFAYDWKKSTTSNLFIHRDCKLYFNYWYIRFGTYFKCNGFGNRGKKNR